MRNKKVSHIKSWVSSWKKGDTVLALCLKSKPYIEYLKSCGFNVTVFENNDFNKDAITFKTIKDFVNIIKDMNFDHIIMNPPYDKNLHLKILQEAMKHSDDVVNLSPIRWLQDPLAEYKKNSDWNRFSDVREKIETLDEVPNGEACDMFNAGIAMNLGIYHITPQGSWQRETEWYEKIVKKYWLEKRTLIHHWTGDYKGDFTGNFVKLPLLHGHPGQPDWYEITSPDKSYCFTKPDKDVVRSPTVNFATKEEAENFWGTLQTKFYKFINYKCRCTTTPPFECFPWLDDYTHPWTDEMLYEYFDLTEEEIKEIEQGIK